MTGPGNNGVLPVGEDDLHAYVDGQLSPDRREAVERWLASDPEAATRAAFYARLNADLHRRFDHVLAEPIPASMTPAYGERRRAADRRAPTIKTFAIAASWLIAGLIAGWSTHNLVIPPQVVERVVEVPAAGPTLTLQAAAAHAVYTPEVRHPVEVRADEAHLVRWLSNRMGKPIKAPVLDDAGWRLMGGRLLPVTDASGPVACQFMYENADGNRVTLYMKSTEGGDGPISFRYTDERDVGVLYWMDSKLAYAMTGKLPKEDLKTLARKVYDQFNS